MAEVSRGKKGASRVGSLGRPHYKPLPEDEGVDRIEITVEPRYKQSGLSGDEWRVGARVSFFKKGRKVGEEWYGSLSTAAHFLPGDMHRLPEISNEALWGYDGSQCMQPSCANPTTVQYRLKQEFSARGEGPLPGGLECLRAFCDEHRLRGDCGLEDADRNYDEVDG